MLMPVSLIFGMDRCADYNTLLIDHPFLHFAAWHLGDHAYMQEKTVKFLVLNFLQDSSKAACAADISMCNTHQNVQWMYVSSSFGLAKIIDYQSKNGTVAEGRGW